jgi:glycosyltransferase involved in cell wall biosynthesis
VVFHNGIPDDWLDRAAAGVSDWSSRPMEMVTVSNVSPYKRQELVIRAMPDLVARPELAELRYRILGGVEPEYEAHLRRVIRELGLEDHVVVEGRVSDERVQEAFATARCFVLMSVCESFGIPSIEAMSWGTPVVTAACCAMPEVCGDAADLCPMDDLNELKTRLARTLTDGAHAERLRQAGLEQIKRYRWSGTVGRMADELERMIDS